MFSSRPVDLYDQHVKRYLLIMVRVLFIFSLNKVIKTKKIGHLSSAGTMFVAAAGIAAYSTPCKGYTANEHFLAAVEAPSCFFDSLSATLQKPGFHRRSVRVGACICPWEREISGILLSGLLTFCMCNSKAALALFFALCAVSACTLQYLLGAALKSRSSGVDINHKLSPFKGTKCAGSLFCKEIILLICGFVYKRILNISLIS